MPCGIKRRLSWLPQQDLVREADFCPLPEILGGHDLWLGLVVSHHDGSVLAQEILEHAPDVNDLAKLLADAMERPLLARPSAATKTVVFKEARKVFGHNRLRSF